MFPKYENWEEEKLVQAAIDKGIIGAKNFQKAEAVDALKERDQLKNRHNILVAGIMGVLIFTWLAAAVNDSMFTDFVAVGAFVIVILVAAADAHLTVVRQKINEKYQPSKEAESAKTSD